MLKWIGKTHATYCMEFSGKSQVVAAPSAVCRSDFLACWEKM
jgi:hypothetical protein